LCEESPQKYLEGRVRIAGNWRERTLVLAMRIVMGSGEKWLFWNFVGCFFYLAAWNVAEDFCHWGARGIFNLLKFAEILTSSKRHS
jgi:hypothetical protein